jgi:hypothetical protein
MADKLIIHKPAADMTTKLSMMLLKGTSAFLLLLCVFAFTQSVLAQGIKKDTQVQLLRVSANPTKGFNYDYLLFIPKGTESKSYLLVEPNNTGYPIDDMDVHLERAVFLAAGSSVGRDVAYKMKVPFLVPVFPRPNTEKNTYTHALDRDAMLSKSKDFGRLDLQLLAMIKDSREQLSVLGITVEKKVLLNGFSASGSFVNRFAVLHPESVKAVTAGGMNSILILPLKTLDGKTLNYPLGVNDLSDITGENADVNQFKKIPQLYYMGETDSNDAAKFEDAYSVEEREIIKTLFGERVMPERWEFMKKLYSENGVNAELRTYPKIGHGTTTKMNLDVAAFFLKVLEEK